VNAFDLAQSAYRPTGASTRSEASIEYEALARVTRRIQAAANADAVVPHDLYAALHDNLRLWTVIAEAVADAGNALPEELRARLFYLAEFTLKHTRLVFRREAKPDILLEINRSVMRGLRQQPGQP